MSKNDQEIMLLRQQIADKKEKLAKNKNFSPETNCSLLYNQVRYNLHALARTDIIDLLIVLNGMLISCKDLGIENYKLSGYSLEAWISDLRQKLAIIDQREEKSRLEVLEQKLESLLSGEKKTELEIENIKKILG